DRRHGIAVKLMSVFALNLHNYPDARWRLVADPALIAPAIGSLRFNTSAQRFKRTATRDITLHGQTIRAGDKVVLAFGSAIVTSPRHLCAQTKKLAGAEIAMRRLPAARAGLSPHGGQAFVEFVVEFPKSRGAAFRAALEKIQFAKNSFAW